VRRGAPGGGFGASQEFDDLGVGHAGEVVVGDAGRLLGRKLGHIPPQVEIRRIPAGRGSLGKTDERDRRPLAGSEPVDGLPMSDRD